MLSSFETLIAFRYLRARREEGLISVIALFSLIGIMLGVATLIVVLSVMNGVREELIKSIIGLEGHVSVYTAAGRGIDHYDDAVKTISAIPGVKSAIPKIEGQIMLSHKGRAVGAMAVGFRDEDLDKKPLLSSKIIDGKTGNGILIGNRIAEKMGVRVGDSITLISPEGRATVAGLVPRVQTYPVGGIFSIGMFAYDNGLVVMPFAEAQTYFKLKEGERDAASLIEVMAENPNDAPALARRISETLGPDFRVYDWKSSNGQIFQAVMVQRNVAFFIVMLIILVAAFNIVSSLIMLVREKERQIAILRTLGASRASVLRIFFLCGASIGIIGTGLGLALGLLIAFNTESIQLWLERMMGHRMFADELYFLSHLPAQVNGGEVVTVVGMALGLSFLATLYPARKAASLDPAEVLRHE